MNMSKMENNNNKKEQSNRIVENGEKTKGVEADREGFCWLRGERGGGKMNHLLFCICLFII